MKHWRSRSFLISTRSLSQPHCVRPLCKTGRKGVSHSSCMTTILAAYTQIELGKPESLMTLPRVLLRTLLKPFLSAVLPRLFLTAFKYSQPVLIKEAIRFLTTARVEEDSRDGANLIIAAVVVYTGLAVSLICTGNDYKSLY
jgi:hypothetical protein